MTRALRRGTTRASLAAAAAFVAVATSAFMAERVLGHIISSGIKVLVLAVITGIGTTLFAQFINAGLGAEPDIQQVMAIALTAPARSACILIRF